MTEQVDILGDGPKTFTELHQQMKKAAAELDDEWRFAPMHTDSKIQYLDAKLRLVTWGLSRAIALGTAKELP